MFHRTSTHTRRWLASGALLLAATLAGCRGKTGPCQQPGASGAVQYQGCLASHETIREVTELAPFTVLAIDYYEPGRGGYYSPGVNKQYFRILHGGRVVLEQAERVERWEGVGRNVLLATAYVPDDGGLHLLDAMPGGPLVHHLVTGPNHWEGDAVYEHGYPWGPRRRYLPRRYNSNDGGFLLGIDPFRLQLLPEGSDGAAAPSINTLASVSPDGRVYAYADSRVTPSAIMVVAADGGRRDPVALPLTALPTANLPANPYDALRAWFGASYTWEADHTGAWDIAARRPPGKTPDLADALEELFTDAALGYRNCFAPGNPHCLQGWERAQDAEALTGACCNSPFTYAPAAPVKAFGRPAVALSLRKLSEGGSGYTLLVEGQPVDLATALEQRLRRRKVPFVRADHCPGLADSHVACERKLRDAINWQHPPNDTAVLWRILQEAEENIIILTPTLALALYPDGGGRTWMVTLARYALPPRTGSKAMTPLFHRG
ncbi:hypothetical protein [Massilia sp. IC2-476]|uniref:hypothetical protein n=1 Tax=Massilia sp. IC2-476 TaxID=2887199 RepID=UPI001D116E4E|nr:hypothetical protein [Massilia sp. IC2-476]MCC2972429.1 hypothetical protein [Massilia sp. IC2-476]